MTHPHSHPVNISCSKFCLNEHWEVKCEIEHNYFNWNLFTISVITGPVSKRKPQHHSLNDCVADIKMCIWKSFVTRCFRAIISDHYPGNVPLSHFINQINLTLSLYSSLQGKSHQDGSDRGNDRWCWIRNGNGYDWRVLLQKLFPR